MSESRNITGTGTMVQQNAKLRKRKEAAVRAASRFTLRVVLLFLVMVGIAYSAWFAPWTRPVPIKIILAPATEKQ